MNRFPRIFRASTVSLGLAFSLFLTRSSPAAPQAATASPNGVSAPAGGQSATPATPSATPQSPAFAHPELPPSVGLNIVVLDPAHGGTDLGARGTEGIHESEVVLQFADQAKRALEGQGFQVILTRQTNDNPSFDDRSARVNAQRGAIFVTLHIASTGLPGTVRTYVMSDFASTVEPAGLIPWDRAQAPFLGLSHKLGDLVQAEMAKRFRGSPPTAETAPIRQLRTTAAPAIAIEISSVVVPSRAELDRMIPGVADALAKGVAAFRPSYVVPGLPGTHPGGQP